VNEREPHSIPFHFDVCFGNLSYLSLFRYIFFFFSNQQSILGSRPRKKSIPTSALAVSRLAFPIVAARYGAMHNGTFDFSTLPLGTRKQKKSQSRKKKKNSNDFYTL